MSDFEEVRNAIRKGDLELVKSLFKAEHTDFTDDAGWSPLHWACGYNKNHAIVQFLLDEGCDMEAETTNNKWRPIHLAVFNGSLSIAQELIDRGCQINVKTSRGETPIDVAIEWKKEGCVKMLRIAAERLESEERRRSVPDNAPFTDLVPSLTNYKKGPMLGRGGFGVVYKCNDLGNGLDFAMKEVPVCTANNVSKDVKCLENEINIYTKLMSHHRIVRYYGTVQDQNAMYIFMEFMAGGSIKDQLNQYGPLSESVIAKYMRQILEGLLFLHNKTIIHRDIKASNILRDTHGNVKLSDFGTSRYLATISQTTVTHTSVKSRHRSRSVHSIETNTLCGTFYWMAPEVIRGERYNISADVWSLGATCVEMLTGNHPYHDLEPCAALFKIGSTSKIEFKPPQPTSKELQQFINKMFTANPRKRPSVEVLLKSQFLV